MSDQPCMACDCCQSWLERDRRHEQIAKELFAAFLNRIYNVSAFDRIGPQSDRERAIIDAWLERDNNGQA